MIRAATQRWRDGLAALALGLLVALAPAAAAAHAVLVAADPADGSMSADPPARFTLTFNEPVSPLVIRLVGPGGNEQALASVTQDGERVVVTPAGELAGGTHLLSWRVVSADGHPVGGTVVFSVGHESEGGPPALAASAPAAAAIWLARAGIYVGLFVGVGGVFFMRWAMDSPLEPPERILAAVLLLAVVAVIASIGLQGIDLVDLSLAQLADQSVWRAGLESAYATTAALALAAVLAAIFALGMSSRRAAVLVAALALGAAGTALAAGGHASSASPQILMRPALFVHAVCIAFWIGALLPLAMLLLGRGGDARPSLLRFSRAAPYAVAALIVSGAVLAVVQVGEIRRALAHGLWPPAAAQGRPAARRLRYRAA